MHPWIHPMEPSQGSTSWIHLMDHPSWIIPHGSTSWIIRHGSTSWIHLIDHPSWIHLMDSLAEQREGSQNAMEHFYGSFSTGARGFMGFFPPNPKTLLWTSHQLLLPFWISDYPGNKWPQKSRNATKPRRNEQHIPQNFPSSSVHLPRDPSPGLLPGQLTFQGRKMRPNR